MKSKVDLIHSNSKSSLSMIPDTNYLVSFSKQEKNQSLTRKKNTKSTERLKLLNESPLSVINSKITLTKTKESSLIIKNTVKKISKNIGSVSNSSTKTFNSQKNLPELNKMNKKEDHKTSVFKSVLNTLPPKELKFINLNEDLKLNSFYLQGSGEYKSQSWLENVVEVKDWKFDERELADTLRFCNKLIRDIMIRLKNVGKENESILLDKIWTAHFEVIDRYIEECDNKIEKYKENIEKMDKEKIWEDEKVKEIDVKANSKNYFRENSDKVKNIIGRVQKKLDQLTEIFKDRAEVGSSNKFRIAGKSLNFDKNQKTFKKKSLDICEINILRSNFK